MQILINRKSGEDVHTVVKGSEAFKLATVMFELKSEKVKI